jgi:hypothetical protein
MLKYESWFCRNENPVCEALFLADGIMCASLGVLPQLPLFLPSARLIFHSHKMQNRI